MVKAELRKYDYIDALRGIAIIGVIMVHTSGWISPSSNFISNVAREGARGVQLFYVASALTLFLSMATRKKQESKPVVFFYIRRFFRIAPLFYLAIVMYVAYYGMSPRYTAPNGIEWWHIMLTALFVQGWHPETINSVVPGGWSIAVEMTFYLIVPYLFIKLKGIKSTLAVLFVSLIISKVLSLALGYVLLPYYSSEQKYLVGLFSFLWFFSQLPIFLLGILLYHIIQKHSEISKITGAGILLISGFMFVAFLETKTFGNLIPQHFLYGVAFVSFAFALSIYPSKIFVNRVTIWIGKLSFSLYILHFIILDLMREIFKDEHLLTGDVGYVLGVMIILAISVCAAFLSYSLIELPGINLGKRLILKASCKDD